MKQAMGTVFRFPMYECRHCHYKADLPYLPGDPTGCRGCRTGKGDCHVSGCPECAEARPLTVSAEHFYTVTVADEETAKQSAEEQFYQPVVDGWSADIRARVEAEEQAGTSSLTDGERSRRLQALQEQEMSILEQAKATRLAVHGVEYTELVSRLLQQRADSLAYWQQYSPPPAVEYVPPAVTGTSFRLMSTRRTAAQEPGWWERNSAIYRWWVNRGV